MKYMDMMPPVITYHLARGIIRKMFSGLPARDAETIANVRAELFAAERLKDLCKQLGLAVSTELQSYQVPQAPKYPPTPPPLRFLFCQEKEKQKAAEEQAKQTSAAEGVSDIDVKPDIKPPRRLTTMYLGRPGLLRMSW